MMDKGCELCVLRWQCDAQTGEECSAILEAWERRESLLERKKRLQGPMVGTVLECVKA